VPKACGTDQPSIDFIIMMVNVSNRERFSYLLSTVRHFMKTFNVVYPMWASEL